LFPGAVNELFRSRETISAKCQFEKTFVSKKLTGAHPPAIGQAPQSDQNSGSAAILEAIHLIGTE